MAALNFLIYPHALCVRSSFVAQVCFFFHASGPDFRNQVFSIPSYRLFRYLWFACLNRKTQDHTSELWTFWFTHALLCLPSSFVLQVWFFLHVSRPTIQNSKFSNSILKHVPWTSIRMFEYKNQISHKPVINFLSYSRALVCAFLICVTRLLFPSCLCPWVLKSQIFDSIS